jgi:hypothetical protein
MSCMHSNIKGRQNTKGGNPRQKPILVKAQGPQRLLEILEMKKARHEVVLT